MRHRSFWLALAVAPACGAEPAAPAVTGVAPAAAVAGAQVPLDISGRFDLAIDVRFGGGAPSAVRTAFRATLGGVALADVAYVDAGRLTATLPGNVPVGVHDLVVEDPAGRRARLPGAFTVEAGAACAAPCPAPPVAAAVGTFAKAADPGVQVVSHGLGVAPAALLLWSVGAPSATAYRFALGVSDAPGSSRSTSLASRGGAADYNGCRTLATSALSIVEWGEVIAAEAELVAWDQGSFTLDWSLNDASTAPVHYAVLGGAEVRAALVPWQLPNVTGPLHVTGVGFRPDAVLHFHMGAFFSEAPPSIDGIASLAVGAMDAAGRQWAMHTYAANNLLKPGSPFARRGQRTDATIYTLFDTTNDVNFATFASMDPDGFTLDFSAATAEVVQAFSLALGGVSAEAGSFTKATAPPPALQSVGTGSGAVPTLALLWSTQGDGAPGSGSRAGMGAAAASGVAAAALSEANAQNPIAAFSAASAGHAFLKMDNDTGALDAGAELEGFFAGGVRLRWTRNDAAAAELLYLTLGAP